MKWKMENGKMRDWIVDEMMEWAVAARIVRAPFARRVPRYKARTRLHMHVYVLCT